ncbi:head-tail joining protein [Methylolobus aquaticus]
MAFGAALERLNRVTLSTFANATVARTGYPPFQAVFDHRTSEQDVFDHMPGDVSGLFSGPIPVITASDTDVVGLGQGDGLMVNAVAYTVRDMQPDGAGFVRVTLKKA